MSTSMYRVITCLILASFATPLAAQDKPVCGPEVKRAIAQLLADAGADDDPYSAEALAVQAELYDAYKYCAADGTASAAALPDSAYCGKQTYAGSTYYERMRCCGYDPQHQFFACPVEILQSNGYGPAPVPGSFEHVLTCVDRGNGWELAARDNVHLADAVSGQPVWNFQVFARARRYLSLTELQGQTFRARSILSWGFAPTSCNFQPIWGNVLEYKIRLDR